MKITLKVGQSEVNLGGWDIVILALSGFGLLAPGTAQTLLQGLEKRARGAGSAVASWFFDARQNPAGGAALPSRWDVAVDNFEAIRITTFAIYLIEMLAAWVLYAFFPFIPYGGTIILFVFILMALTPWFGFMYFGLEFILPGLAAFGELIPKKFRGTGDPVGEMKRGIINTLIPISILWIVLGILAVFLSAPILPRPGIAFTMRAVSFGFAMLVGFIYILTDRKFFKAFLVITLLGSAVTIVGAHTWWRTPNPREAAVADANTKKDDEEIAGINKGDFRKVILPISSFWRELDDTKTRLYGFENLQAGVVLEIGEKLDALPPGSQLLIRTVRPAAAFWHRDLSTGTTTLEALPQGTELGVMVVGPTMPPATPVVGPAIQVQLRDKPTTTGYVAQVDTNYGVMHLASPVFEVWTRYGQFVVHGYVSMYDVDKRTNPWEDRPDSPPWWRQAWEYVSGNRPPDPVPTVPYSPPGTGTAVGGNQPAAMRGAASFLLTLQVRGGGSYTVIADGIAYPLSPILNPPLLGGMTKFEDPTGVDPSKIVFGWILANGDPKSFVPAVRRGPDLTLYGSGTAAQMKGWVVGALIK